MDEIKAPTVSVHIEAGERGAEVTLVDSSFRTLSSAIDYLDIDLVPGFYKARFKAGDRVTDQLFEVLNETLYIRGESLLFSSPIPIEKTSNNHEYQHYPALALITAPPSASFGSGAEVFLFVRDSKHKYGTMPSDPPPWRDLCLRKCDGTVLLMLEEGIVNAFEGHAGIKVSLNPGTYYVSTPVPSPGELTLNLPVIASAGLATHVYLDCRDAYTLGPSDSRSLTYRAADVSGAAIVMVGLHESTQVLTRDLTRLTEVARQALLFGQGAIGKYDLEAMIYGKFQFPMLGLYALHLLMRQDPVPWPLVKEMSVNLQKLLGDSNPDVEIFLSACARHEDPAAVTTAGVPWPPMLSMSWDLAAHNRENWQRNTLDAALRQYRVGGSLWTCLQLPWGSVEPALNDERPARSGVDYGPAPTPQLSQLFQEFSTTLGPLPLPPSSVRRFSSFWQIFGLRNRRPSAEAAPAPPTASFIRAAIFESLRKPNPQHTPFQQALRRLLLDTYLAPDESDLPSFEETFYELANQFRVSPQHAVQILERLLADASRKIS